MGMGTITGTFVGTSNGGLYNDAECEESDFKYLDEVI